MSQMLMEMLSRIRQERQRALEQSTRRSFKRILTSLKQLEPEFYLWVVFVEGVAVLGICTLAVSPWTFASLAAVALIAVVICLLVIRSLL